MIKVTYNQDYRGNYLSEVINKAFESIAQQLKERLKPFEKELEQTKGTIFINFSDDLKNITIKGDNISSELLHAIRNTFYVDQKDLKVE